MDPGWPVRADWLVAQIVHRLTLVNAAQPSEVPGLDQFVMKFGYDADSGKTVVGKLKGWLAGMKAAAKSRRQLKKRQERRAARRAAAQEKANDRH